MKNCIERPADGRRVCRIFVKMIMLGMLLAIAVPAVRAMAAEPSLSETKLVLAAGRKHQLSVNKTKKTVTWTSTHPEIARVSSHGKIYAKTAGKTTIRAKMSGNTLKCKVVVRDPYRDDEKLAEDPGKWKKQYGSKYYLLADGSMAVGARTIGGTVYIFNENGALQQPEKASVLSIGKYMYYVSPEGKGISGWQIIGKKLYRTNQRGRVVTDKVFEGVTLQKDGSAKNNSAAIRQMTFTKTVSSLVKDSMTNREKLRACWNYLVSKRNFRYAMKYPNLSEKDWQKKTAYNMLTTHSGNCYSFACAFAAMAHEIGYNSYVVCGRVSGSRDHASDGLTRHSWVRIGGMNYDPEGQFAGWYRGCYGSGGYRIRHTVQRTVRFAG